MKYSIPDHHPKIVVISAPSGAGKTTLNRRLMKDHPEIEISVSHTTRKPRSGEIDGIHYHFISPEVFKTKADRGEFVEWANVHGNMYGTSRAELDRIAAKGHIALLEIDVQGWAITRHKIPEAIAIFIIPPSLKILWQRLEDRASDPLKTRWVRFQNAYDEIAHAENYKYFLINDDLERCYALLERLVLTGQMDKKDMVSGVEWCARLQEEFAHADWIKSLKDSIDQI